MMFDLQLAAIAQLRTNSPEKFKYQQPVTPQPLIQEITANLVADKAASVLVLFTVEWALYLREIGFTNIVVSAITDPTIAKACAVFGLKYQELSEIEENNMKFDVVVGNPPYKQGLWRKLMKQAIGLSNRYMVFVCPNATVENTTKFKELHQLLMSSGIQQVTNCQEFFSNEGVNVITNSEIAYHLFDVTQPGNSSVFAISRLTETELLAKSIVEKVEAANQLGVLTQTRKIGKSKAVVPVITSITKDGPVIVSAAEVNPAHIKVVDNPGEYFYVNRFFGMNTDDTVYHTSSPIAINTERVYAIGNIKSYTVDQFKRIYFSKLIRFVLAQYRGKSMFCFGWSIRKLPVVPVDADLYSYFNLTQEEIDLIESTVK